MPKYTIPLIIHEYKTILVEADNMDEAADKAENLIFEGDLETHHITPDSDHVEIDWDLLESCNPEETQDA